VVLAFCYGELEVGVLTSSCVGLSVVGAQCGGKLSSGAYSTEH